MNNTNDMINDAIDGPDVPLPPVKPPEFGGAQPPSPQGMTVSEGMGVMNGPQYVAPQVDVGQAQGQFAMRGGPQPGDDQFATDHANPAMHYQMGPSGGNMQPNFPASGSPYDDRVTSRSDSDVNQLNLNASRGGTGGNVDEQDDYGALRGIQLQKLRHAGADAEPTGHWEGNNFVNNPTDPNSSNFGDTPQGRAMYDLMSKVISNKASPDEKKQFVDTYLSQSL